MAWISIIYDQLLIIFVAFVSLDLNYLIDQEIFIDQRNFWWSDYQTFWEICSINSCTLPQRSAFSFITNFSTIAILQIVQYIILQAAVAGLNSYFNHDLSCIEKLYKKSADYYKNSYIWTLPRLGSCH